MMLSRLSALSLIAAACLPLPAMAGSAPEQAAAPVDPASLPLATQTVDYIFPAGTYARIMDETMDKMMETIIDSTMSLPLRDLVAIGGVAPESLDDVPESTMAEINEIYDPHFRERMQISTRATMDGMSALMTGFEPEIREGLAQAYARKYAPDQLREMNAFFATPTGTAYARDAFVMFMDPEVMSRMQAFMPKVMKEMPGIVKSVEAATADLPAPRAYDELSQAERDKLAQLLGTTREKLDAKDAEREFPSLMHD